MSSEMDYAQCHDLPRSLRSDAGASDFTYVILCNGITSVGISVALPAVTVPKAKKCKITRMFSLSLSFPVYQSTLYVSLPHPCIHTHMRKHNLAYRTAQVADAQVSQHGEGREAVQELLRLLLM